MNSQSTASSNRRRALFLLLSLVLAFTSPLGAEDAAQKQLAALRMERISVLEELVKWREHEYSEGLSPFESVFRALNQLADAKLEAAKNPAKRLAIRRESVERWEKFEKLVISRFEAQLVSQGDMLQAKAGRLKSRLLLLEESDTKE